MPAGRRELAPLETVSGVPIFEIAPDILACAGGVSKVNAAMAAELLCLRYGVDLILNAGVAGCFTDLPPARWCSVGIRPARCGHHRCGGPHRPGLHGESGGLPHLAAGALCGAACFPGLSRRHRPGIHRGLVCCEGAAGGVDPGYLLPLADGDGGGAIAQVCLRNGVRFVSVKSVSDHLFSDSQAEEYFDFGQALEALAGRCCPWPRHFKKLADRNGAPGGDDPRRALVSRQLCSAGPSGSTVNTSSMGTPNTWRCSRPAPARDYSAPSPGFRWSPAGPHQLCQLLLLQAQTARCSFIRLRITAPAPSSPGSRTRRRSGRRPPQRQPSQPCSR